MTDLTKTVIRSSLIKLLEEKPVSKITVKDIVEECGVNRNTFYYHYQDIPSLLEEIIIAESDRIISNYTEFSSIEDCFDVAISFAMENKKTVLHIHNSNNRELYEQFLWRVCEHAVSEFINHTVTDDIIPDEDKAVFIQHYKCMCYGLISDWLNSGMKTDVKADFHRFCEIKRKLGDPILSL
ncbi:MAG: TetR/AcrR family transcriptional regulator [Ruminococcus sp.]|nr:TetR/AcrR family transcriptional regulator [Ruminococcus sp.]